MGEGSIGGIWVEELELSTDLILYIYTDLNNNNMTYI